MVGRMTEHIATFFRWLPDELITACLAALPVTELRGSIPWATFVLNMTWQKALLWSIVGNFIPVPFILKLLVPVNRFLRRWEIFDLFFQWLYERTRRRGKMIERSKAFGLILLVAIPLPVTGAWTGSVAAHIFGIRFVPALLYIITGICIAGTVVTLACQGVIGIWDFSRGF